MADQKLVLDNLNIKAAIGNLTFNVLYIDYEAPRPLWYYGPHSHSSYELHLVPEGRGKLVVAGREYDLYPGCFYITGPEIVHEQKADARVPMSEYCINFEISLSKRKPNKNEMHLGKETEAILKTLTETNFWYGSDNFGTEALFRQLIKELENGFIGCITYVETLSTQIILNAIRCFTGNEKADYTVPRKNLVDSRRYIVDNYFRDFDRQLSSRELAGIIGTSVRQLDRIIAGYYSMTFKEKLSAVRLEQACKLLSGTSLKLWEIAEKIGFTSQDSFSQTFKSHYSVSPGQFRKNTRN